jgi:ribosomal protein S27E
MEKVGDILKNAIPDKKSTSDKVSEIKSVKCVNCGNIVTFKPKQFRQFCSKCGLSIAIKPEKDEKKDIKCWICCDAGFVIYHAQVNGQIVEYAARCLCPEGADKGERIPVITQCINAPPIELIKVRNLKEHGKDSKGAELHYE